MLDLDKHIQLQVTCPVCPASYAVQLSVVAESQRLLDEVGPCVGMASYECPAPYFAALVPPAAIAELQVAVSAFERAAHRWGVQPVLDGSAGERPRSELTSQLARVLAEARDPRSRAVPVEAPRERAAEAVALARWEDEGGAPETTAGRTRPTAP